VDTEGFIHVIDRLKELIKVNGLQVEFLAFLQIFKKTFSRPKVAPAELEDLLLSHPDIQDCAVVGVPDPTCGELPKAFVVRRPGSAIGEEEVKQFVKSTENK
jgi:4-coumarate--CoA ligase